MLRTFYICVLIAVASTNSFANDSTASKSPYGLILTETKGISIEKEILTITKDKVKVEYDFRNNTDSDITTLVAFPFPDIICSMEDPSDYPEGFSAVVDGESVALNKEVKAILVKYGEEDITEILLKNNLPANCEDITDINSYKAACDSNEMLKKLVDLDYVMCEQEEDGAVKIANYVSRIKYYWEQTFPKKTTLHVQHEYEPGVGHEYRHSPIKGIDEYYNLFKTHYKETWGKHELNYKRGLTFRKVNYILKTANNWDGPIKDFTLKIPLTTQYKNWPNKVLWTDLVQTSMSGPIDIVEGNLVIKKKDFVPSEDLRVYLFDRY